MSTTLVVDTGIIIGLATRSKVGVAVHEAHLKTASMERPLVSVVSIAECRSIARFNNWGAPKREKLEALLAGFTAVGIETDSPLIEKYAEIYGYLRSVGNNWEKNQNDLWIAALASVTDGLLLTTDFKLQLLAPTFLKIETYHPETGERA